MHKVTWSVSHLNLLNGKYLEKILVLIVYGIYREQYSETTLATQALFMNKVIKLLERLTLRTEPIILLGDFNIHVDDPSDTFAKNVLNILNTFGY